ncbi:unnamed protein product [Linum tenue]|uniref:Uncharacterized protein n=1 Tax=Linum tenue TaxID=586396 RepID=A0AAV0R4Y5_9ROSI|nr:unnamed protein product [Linum tenue]
MLLQTSTHIERNIREQREHERRNVENRKRQLLLQSSNNISSSSSPDESTHGGRRTSGSDALVTRTRGTILTKIRRPIRTSNNNCIIKAKLPVNSAPTDSKLCQWLMIRTKTKTAPH